ncbi:MAG: flagellar biosynthesis anti-sigma factor FlgM [Phycisphaerae bacterium]|nr:flagellar biosynthesis anti-sigma factor FlgM [Phycisphaerae bacterium]
MATSTLTKRLDLKSAGLGKLRTVVMRRGRGTHHIGDARIGQILEIMKNRPWDQVAKKIAAVPDIRRGKVLNMRYRIAKGTYPTEDQLDKVADRVLRQLTS